MKMDGDKMIQLFTSVLSQVFFHTLLLIFVFPLGVGGAAIGALIGFKNKRNFLQIVMCAASWVVWSYKFIRVTIDHFLHSDLHGYFLHLIDIFVANDLEPKLLPDQDNMFLITKVASCEKLIKLPKINISNRNIFDTSGNKTCCSVCLQDFEVGNSAGTFPKSKKFEDLVDPSPDTERKLELMYQIPHRERASFSEVATSEASFSSEHTPSMSSAVPKSGAKFSLADIKANMVKKEKFEETPAPKPVHVPATRSKISARKRKAVDPVIQLESFEGLTAMEVKDKMHSLYSMIHLGFEQMHELLKEHEEELLRSKEAYNDLKKLAEKKDGYYKQKEETYANVSREFEEFKVKAEEKEKLIVEEAKNSATTTVFESMYEMAKEAKAAGFSLPHWDLQGWATILGKEDELSQANSKAPEAAAGKGGAGDGVATGDDSKDAQA